MWRKKICYILFLFASVSMLGQDEKLEKSAEEILQKRRIEVTSVEIVDGINNGFPSLIVSYKTSDDDVFRKKELLDVLIMV